jgi:hypothetical protein
MLKCSSERWEFVGGHLDHAEAVTLFSDVGYVTVPMFKTSLALEGIRDSDCHAERSWSSRQ